MPSSIVRRAAAAGAAGILTAVCAIPAGAVGTIGVTLNGSALNLNPAPTERAGRVFVPLRGVFENMGATVVYSNGLINATRRGHTVSLHIGSQQATVDGQNQTLDVAPFIIGASTYVPLRFISQALGASVNWDGNNDVVAITMAGGGGRDVGQGPPPSQVITPSPDRGDRGGNGLALRDLQPASDATVRERRPTIQANFAGGDADPNSIRVFLDGTDVTGDATRSPRGVTYQPPSPLQAGGHRVRVTGVDRAGVRFEREWRFTTGY